MDKQELIDFLKKFDINDEIINNLTNNKKIIEKNQNIYLVEKEFEKNQVFTSNMLIFIKLEMIIPSRYLTEFIQKNTQNIVEITSDKQIQKLIYSKDLSKDVLKGQNLEKEKYYLVTNQKNPIGIIEYTNQKNYPIKNVFNVGEYIKE